MSSRSKRLLRRINISARNRNVINNVVSPWKLDRRRRDACNANDSAFVSSITSLTRRVYAGVPARRFQGIQGCDAARNDARNIALLLSTISYVFRSRARPITSQAVEQKFHDKNFIPRTWHSYRSLHRLRPTFYLLSFFQSFPDIASSRSISCVYILSRWTSCIPVLTTLSESLVIR